MNDTLFFIEGGEKHFVNDIIDAPLVNETAEISFEVNIQRAVIDFILQETFGFTRMALDMALDMAGGRVAHLAKHGGKARTRKKNRSRAFRLLEVNTVQVQKEK